jgi:glycosyltransferase involved in cell wall biosynthesis
MKLPSLYKGADAFVIATHGEGWGLPIIEAMAMQLPVIATNWSGSTGRMNRNILIFVEFLRSSNSYLIPVESMVKSSTPGHQWAQPSKDALKVAMRTVLENKREVIDCLFH